jgi:hypothetical protein
MNDFLWKLELFKRKMAFKLLGWHNIIHLEVGYRDEDGDLVKVHMLNDGILHKEIIIQPRILPE